MVAAAILFNGSPALGAWLGVCEQPVECFGIVLTLYEPTLQILAAARRVVVIAALKAKALATEALNTLGPRARFHRPATIGRWAPFHTRVVIYKRAGWVHGYVEPLELIGLSQDRVDQRG